MPGAADLGRPAPWPAPDQHLLRDPALSDWKSLESRGMEACAEIGTGVLCSFGFGMSPSSVSSPQSTFPWPAVSGGMSHRPCSARSGSALVTLRNWPAPPGLVQA